MCLTKQKLNYNKFILSQPNDYEDHITYSQSNEYKKNLNGTKIIS